MVYSTKCWNNKLHFFIKTALFFSLQFLHNTCTQVVCFNKKSTLEYDFNRNKNIPKSFRGGATFLETPVHKPICQNGDAIERRKWSENQNLLQLLIINY